MTDSRSESTPEPAVLAVTTVEVAAGVMAWFVALAGGALGIAFALFTPPFQVPDEPAHFLRAVATSEGHFFTRHEGQTRGQNLPRWALDYAAVWTDNIPGNISRKAPPGWLLESRPSARSNGARVFVEVPQSPGVKRLGYSAASYSPLPYLLPALSVRVAVLAGLSPVGVLLVIRLLNMMIALAITVVAVRLSGASAPLMSVVAMLPMAVFMRSSASADGLTMSIGLLIIALTCRCTWNPPGSRRAGELTALAALSFLVCLTKPNLALALLPLTVPRERLGKPAIFRGAVAVAVAAGLAVASIWGHDAARAAPGMAANAARQLTSIGLHPALFILHLGRTWTLYSPRYLDEIVGKFGWLDTYLPGPLVVAAYALLIYSSLVWGPRLTAARRTLYWLFAGSAALLVVTALHISWNIAGNTIVDGVQGRYFLPFLPLIFLPLSSERFRRPLERTSLLALCACQTTIVSGSLIVLVRRFYG